ncbi:MAG: DUF4124 domain-containing protein [Thermodesulfobacteriota bacterium]
MFDERASLVYTLTMRYAFLAAVFLFALAAVSHAAIYRWMDKVGVLHVTDDEFKVPAEYRKNMTVIEETEILPAAQTPVETAPTMQNQAAEEELYGGRTLQWWKAEIKRRKDDMARNEQERNTKKQFIEVFEKGFITGQVYEQSEVDTYRKYKNEIPELEKLNKKLAEELEDIKDRARRAGVSKKDRE